MAFLNGIIVHGSLTLKNLIVKFTSNVFAVSSGLPAGVQAPIITYGSVDRPGMASVCRRFVGLDRILLDILKILSASAHISKCIIYTVGQILAVMQLAVNRNHTLAII